MSNLWDKFFKKQWTQNKKWDPLTHRLLELTVHQDAHNVGAIDHGISKMFGGDGSTVIGDESRKVEKDPVRGIGRAALTAGAVFGGMYAAGAYGGGGGAGAGAAAGGVGEAGAAGGTMGMGEIGASGMTPALMESAVGTSGYGLSSAGLGYTGAAEGAGGVAAFNMGATNPALIDSAMGTSGYGASSAGPGGGAGTSASLTPDQWRRLGQQVSKSGDQQQRQEKEIDKVDLAALVALAAQEEANRGRMALSTRRAKRPGGDGHAMKRGLANADPIDANGVHIAAAKELVKEIAALQKRVDALKAKRATRKGN